MNCNSSKFVATLAASASILAIASGTAYALNPQPLPPKSLTLISVSNASAVGRSSAGATAIRSVLGHRALNPQPLPPRRLLAPVNHSGVTPQTLERIITGMRIRF